MSESFEENEYVPALISKTTERIQDKEANKEYCDFKKRFDKSILIVYADDLLITADVLEIIASQNSYTMTRNTFDEVYLYIRPAIHTSPSGNKVIDGFYLLARRVKNDP